MGGAGRPFFTNNLIGFVYGSFANDYGCSGTLLKTTDGGNSWIELHTLPECITNLNFTTPEIGYAFTFDNNVYKTTNGGGSWKLLTTFDGGLYFSSAIIGNTIYYATGTFIFKTTNDFASITKIYESSDNNAALSIKAISPNKNLLFILSNHSVIKIIKKI